MDQEQIMSTWPKFLAYLRKQPLLPAEAHTLKAPPEGFKPRTVVRMQNGSSITLGRYFTSDEVLKSSPGVDHLWDVWVIDGNEDT